MWGSQEMEMYQYKSKEHVNVSWKDMEYNHFEPRKEHTALKFRMNSLTVYLVHTEKLPFSNRLCQRSTLDVCVSGPRTLTSLQFMTIHGALASYLFVGSNQPGMPKEAVHVVTTKIRR